MRERWLAQRGTDLSEYGEHVRDLMRPNMLSLMLIKLNMTHMLIYGRDLAYKKVILDARTIFAFIRCITHTSSDFLDWFQ